MDEKQAATPEPNPAVAAPSESTPSSAGHLRLFSKHEWLRVGIGSTIYAFRTLSLSDVIEIQPHLDRLLPAMLKGQGTDEFNLIYATEGIAILKAICPQILEDVESVKAINTPIINEVIAFYKQQDWNTVKQVKALRSSTGSADEELANGMSDRDTFFALAGLCAERSRESVPQFLDQRVEYCMHAILALHAEYKRKSTEGKIPHGAFANMMTGIMGGKTYTQDTAPDWIKSLSARAELDDKQG